MSTHTLIQAEALAGRLGDSRLRIFDCRFDLSLLDAGRERYRFYRERGYELRAHNLSGKA